MICKICSRKCKWYSKVFQDCDKCTKRCKDMLKFGKELRAEAEK